MSGVGPLSDEWLAAVVDASAGRPSAGGLNGSVTMTVPRHKLTLRFDDGKIVGSQDEESETVVPFTGKQYQAWLQGELNLSASYTKGDLRATGPTGPLLAALEVFDDPRLRAAIVGA